MHIPLVAAVGYGSTLLSAFNDALRACGVFVDKMILFSLVILPDSEVVTRAPPQDRCT
jgi:pyruvoyl-dependent arginine decarboxylase (PvlArgDC)